MLNVYDLVYRTDENILFCATSKGLEIVDITDPESMFKKGTIATFSKVN